jgi:hypothetical protein
VSPAARRPRGLLRRRSVTSTIEIYIGKETNKLEETDVGLIHNLSKVLEVYADLKRGPWERLVRPVMKAIPARWLEERTGLSRRTIQRLRNGDSRPRKEHERVLMARPPTTPEPSSGPWVCQSTSRMPLP